MAEHNFDSFTKQKRIEKSTELLLVPQGRTQMTIEEQHMDDYDADMRGRMERIAPYIDIVMRMIIDKALSDLNVSFDSAEYSEANMINAVAAGIQEAVPQVTRLKKVEEIKAAKFLQDKLPELLLKSDEVCDKEEMLSAISGIKGKRQMMERFLVSRLTILKTLVPKRVTENYDRYLKNTKKLKTILASDAKDEVLAAFPHIEDYTGDSFYADCLTQKGIERYNTAIHGIIHKSGIKSKGINLIINEYNQQKGVKKLPLLKELHKQILYPTEKQYKITAIEDDRDLIERLKTALPDAIKASEMIGTALTAAKEDDAVVSYNALYSLSFIISGDAAEFPTRLNVAESEEIERSVGDLTSKKAQKQYEKKLAGLEKKHRSHLYTFGEVCSYLNDNTLFDKFKKAYNIAHMAVKKESEELLEALSDFKCIKENVSEQETLSMFFDTWTEYRKILRLVSRKDSEAGDAGLYNIIDDCKDSIQEIGTLERKTLSYVTKNPDDLVKKNCAFYGSHSRNSMQWIQFDGEIDKQKVTILKRDGKYYVLMLTDKTKPLSLLGNGPDKVFAQKKGQKASMFLPNVIFKKAKTFFAENPDASQYVIDENMKNPVVMSREIFNIYADKLFTRQACNKKGYPEEIYKEFLYKYMDLIKEFIENYNEYSDFDIKLADLHEYEDTQEFFADIDAGNFASKWLSADGKKIDKLVEQGNALMFLIFSRTLYIKNHNRSAYDVIPLTALSEDTKGVQLLSNPKFSTKNASITNPVVHKKGSELVCRFDTDEKRIPEEVYLELLRYYNKKLYMPDLSAAALEYVKSGKVKHFEATHDIIKDRRYTMKRAYISFSVRINSDVKPVSDKSYSKELNKRVGDMASTMNVLTIIRSKEDLIYYVITAPDGRLLESQSLNVLKNHDYWKELKEISDKRREDKSKKWIYDTKVKEKRDAYIGDAISYLVRKVLEYNSVVVMELISEEIKDKASSLDNTVYKSFENKFISRLADLHFKNVENGDPGSVSNPYQLCSKSGNTYQDGIVYFMTTDYTKGVDLESGFVNLFNFSLINTATEKKRFIASFDSIKYDKTTGRFRFTFNYDNFSPKKVPTKKGWTVYVGGPVVRYNREYKYNTYHAETASGVCKIIEENHSINVDYATLAKEGSLTGKEVSALFDIFRTSVFGAVHAHDGIRKKYISPVSRKEYDYAENTALALTRKFRWFHINEDSRGEWINNIS